MKKKNITLNAYFKLYRETKLKLIVYSVLYYLLNASIILFTLLNGVIAILFLAGASSYYPDGVTNPYTSFLNSNSNYIILLTIVNAIITFTSGILSFFVINKKAIFYQSKIKAIQLEHLLYKSKLHIYKDLNNKEANFTLFKRTMSILEIDRYKSSDIEKEVNNVQKQN
ncbi:hypothetical protein [Mycoplasma sp. 21DD0573]|uniref:hypothetical protein n=1 Tax=unclassified Mycoplasma TaxID=2683645 RepID=UPI002B1DDCA4|nr:hypothetical protein [Mycoplasma sp. 21DD0573]MEA4276202.1 hypothetical protein [Mycoplasma sp. 21DD0573]